jgi:hypothetical protein
MQIKRAGTKPTKPKKRAIEAEGSERPLKRPHTHVSQSRDTTISSNSRIILDTRDAQLSDDTITDTEVVSHAVRRQNAPWRPISLSLRSGRSTNLPKRFER